MVEILVYLLAGAVIVFSFVAVICCVILSGNISREEERRELTEKVDPCATCLRWSECNGVDRDFCPICNDSPKEGGSGHG